MQPRNTFGLAITLLLISTLVFSVYVNAQEKPKSIDWQDGPVIGKLGDVAQINVPAGFRFTGRTGTSTLMELTQNPTDGNELGALIPKTNKDDDQIWFVIFEFDESGYIQDNEKDKLDASAMLDSIRSATEDSNKIREQKGWPAFHVVGWSREPYYDLQTHNLTWAIQGKSQPPGKPEDQSVNYSVRLLGRRGVMKADLVLSPGQVAEVLPEFQNILNGISFLPGQTYADWRSGDKVAKYGLTALIVGGAATAAVKSGLLLKFWKLIVAGFVGLAAFVKRLYASLKRILSGKAGERAPQQE